jgi:NADH:ubiquinone oxidoreductase subunit 4 (subunit M)
MVYLSLIICILIAFVEINFLLIFLGGALSLISVYFFFVVNFFFLYVFFELSLVPIVLIVLGYGIQIEKINSLNYLIFYSILTTFPFLFVYISLDVGMYLVYIDFLVSDEFLLFFVLGFLMKFPIYFFHYWLPKVHVESPTCGRMLLAGLLLKFGTLGFVRFLGAVLFFNYLVFFYLSLLGILLCRLVCMCQRDSKSLVAYSSVVHMRFLIIVLMFYSVFRKVSALLMMLVHGYVSVIIFFLVGEFFHINLTRLIYYFNRLFSRSLVICLLFSFFLLLNAGFPGRLAFYSELLGISARFIFCWVFGVFMLRYFFLSFYYSLYYIIVIFMGKS